MKDISIEQLPLFLAIKNLSSCDDIPRYSHMTNFCAWFLGFGDAKAAIGKTDYDIPSKMVRFADDFISCDQLAYRTRQKTMTIEFLDGLQGREIAMVEKNFLDDEHVCFQATIITNTPLARNIYPFFSKNPKKSVWLLGKEYPNLGLTLRQQECLFYLIHGKSYKEIADALYVSTRTIEHHVEKIRKTLDCSSTSAIINKAFEEGFAYFVPLSLMQKGDTTNLL